MLYGNKSAIRMETFNRYSRHFVEERNDNIKANRKAGILEGWIKLTKSLISTDNVVIQSLCEKLVQIFLEQSDVIQDVIFDLSNLNIVTVIGPSFDNSQASKGILLHCNDIFLIDIIKIKKSVKIVLVNTEYYGNKLPGQRELKVIETVQFRDIHNKYLQDADNQEFLKDLNVDIIILRGYIDEKALNELSHHGIVLIRESRYDILQKLAHMCSCDIALNLYKVSSHHISDVQIDLLYQADFLENKTKRVKYRDKACYYVLIKSQAGSKHVSVLLCARSADLCNLYLEELLENLKTIEMCLKNKSVVKNPEKGIIQKLHNVLYKDNGAYRENDLVLPSWCGSECILYENVVLKELAKGFERYDNLYQRNTYQDSLFIKHLWSDSLTCVVNIANIFSRSMKM